MRFSIALVALIVAAATTAEAQDTQSADTIIRGCRSLVSDSTIDDPTDSFLAGIYQAPSMAWLMKRAC